MPSLTNHPFSPFFSPLIFSLCALITQVHATPITNTTHPADEIPADPLASTHISTAAQKTSYFEANLESPALPIPPTEKDTSPYSTTSKVNRPTATSTTYRLPKEKKIPTSTLNTEVPPVNTTLTNTIPLPKKTLTFIAVANPSTFFQYRQQMHGLGYSLSRELANNLKLEFKFKTVGSITLALREIEKGNADIALTVATEKQSNTLARVNFSCADARAMEDMALDTNLNWSMKPEAKALFDAANNHVCSKNQMKRTAYLYRFYNNNFLKSQLVKTSFKEARRSHLTNIKGTFKDMGFLHQIDWHLLLAQGYQESMLVNASVSMTGVKGLMQLTESTARELGVIDRTNPYQSIAGGAKYMRQLLARYQEAPLNDRLWFALAAYNMGPGATDNVRSNLKKLGKNPNSWNDAFAYMAERPNYGQYGQAMVYVTRIRSYYEIVKNE